MSDSTNDTRSESDCYGSGRRVMAYSNQTLVYALCPRCFTPFEGIALEPWPKGSLFEGQGGSAVIPPHRAGKGLPKE